MIVAIATASASACGDDFGAPKVYFKITSGDGYIAHLQFSVTGHELWARRIGEAGSYPIVFDRVIRSQTLVANQRLYWLEHRRRDDVYDVVSIALDGSDEFIHFHGVIRRDHPFAIAGQYLYVRSDYGVDQLDLGTRVLRTFRLDWGNEPSSSGVFGDSKGIFAATASTVYSIAPDGSLSAVVAGGVTHGARFDRKTIHYFDRGKIVALPLDGTPSRNYELDQLIYEFTMDAEYYYVSAVTGWEENRIFQINRTTGETVERMKAYKPLTSLTFDRDQLLYLYSDVELRSMTR